MDRKSKYEWQRKKQQKEKQWNLPLQMEVEKLLAKILRNFKASTMNDVLFIAKLFNSIFLFVCCHGLQTVHFFDRTFAGILKFFSLRISRNHTLAYAYIVKWKWTKLNKNKRRKDGEDASLRSLPPIMIIRHIMRT